MAGFINPERERFGEFRAIDRDGPIHMLNLVRLKETATYEDGTTMSGREAYATYGRGSGPVFTRLGGEIVWSASHELMLIGPGEEYWDVMFVARYPSSAAFVEMVQDPEYQKAVVHRTAAVEDSRLIRTHPQETGKVFG